MTSDSAWPFKAIFRAVFCDAQLRVCLLDVKGRGMSIQIALQTNQRGLAHVSDACCSDHAIQLMAHMHLAREIEIRGMFDGDYDSGFTPKVNLAELPLLSQISEGPLQDPHFHEESRASELMSQRA